MITYEIAKNFDIEKKYIRTIIIPNHLLGCT